jgi:hypothetical protein
VKRVAIVARLKQGEGQGARELIDQGPPYRSSASGIPSTLCFLSASEVVFVFEGEGAVWIEGEGVVWKLDDLTTDSFHPALQAAFVAWEPVLEGRPKIAREAYFWDAMSEEGEDKPGPPRV